MALRTNLLVAVLCASAGTAMPTADHTAAGMAPVADHTAHAAAPAASDHAAHAAAPASAADPTAAKPADTATPPHSDMATIPAGAFRPLYDNGEGSVRVASFRLDRNPVTRAQYAAFRSLPAVPAADANRPATNVTQNDAAAYCSARGARLPTETEWEYAAAASTTKGDGRGDAAFRQKLIELYTRKRGLTPAEVGSTFRNAYGVEDMHGLVWEWVAPEAHHHAAGHHDMSCAASARGATDTSDFAAFLRFAFRSGLTPDMRQPNLGFRCAQ
ncbi:MAG TPA: formylglycine-generating enzyme family protein [Longimicrobiales bacterium]